MTATPTTDATPAASYTQAALTEAGKLYTQTKSAVLSRTESDTLKKAFTQGEAYATQVVGSVDPKTLATVVAAVDQHVDAAVKYAEPHVEALRASKDAVVQSVSDGRARVESYVSESVTAVTERKNSVVNAVSERKDALIDDVLGKTEQVVDYVLPKQAAEEEQTSENKEETTKQARAIRILDTTSKRFKRRALSGLESLRLREPSALVPLDLLKYNELLDLQLVKDKVAGKIGAVQEQVDVVRGQVYDLVMAEYETRVTATLASLEPKVDAARAKVTEVVVVPAREYYAIVVAAYAKVAASEDPVVTVAEFTKQVRDNLGQQWSEKLVRPTQQLLSTLQEEWAKVQEEAEAAGPESAEGVDKVVVLEAYVNAVRARLVALFDQYKGSASPASSPAKAGSGEDLFVDAAEE